MRRERGTRRRGDGGGREAEEEERERREGSGSELDGLLPHPALVLVALERVVEEDLAALGDVDRLVGRLLAQRRDLVLLERALEQLGERFDGLLEVAAGGQAGEGCAASARALERQRERESEREGERGDALLVVLEHDRVVVALEVEGHGVRPLEDRAHLAERLDGLCEELDLDPRQGRVLLELVHLLLGARVQVGLEPDRLLVVGEPVVVLRAAVGLVSSSTQRARAKERRERERGRTWR